MIGLIVIIVACVAMYRIAVMEGRSGALWAGITFAIAFGLSLFLPSFIGAFLGLVASFAAMFVVKLKSQNS